MYGGVTRVTIKITEIIKTSVIGNDYFEVTTTVYF